MFCQMEYRRIHNGEIEIPFDIYGKCKVLTTKEGDNMVIRVWSAETKIDEDEITAMDIISEEDAVIDVKKKKLRLPKVFLDYMGKCTKTAVCGVLDRIELMRASDYQKTMREVENDPAFQEVIDAFWNLEELL